jgi:hypothetical protein
LRHLLIKKLTYSTPVQNPNLYCWHSIRWASILN